MEMHLTDSEVKDAIKDWLIDKMPGIDHKAMKIRRLYYTEGAGYETVVELPEIATE